MAEPVRRCRPLLGTFVEIAVPGDDEAAIEPAFAAIAHVQARMSFHDEASDLAALRRATPGEVVRVDPQTVAVLRFAADLHARSGGLFDVAIGARLVAAGYLPRPPGIDLRGMTGTTADIRFLGEDRIRCDRPMLIDLGGIAKGFAVDRAVAMLAAAGITDAVVNAGGDLRVIGTQKVHLRDADGDIAGAIELTDAALATSSNRHDRRRHRGTTAVPHLGRHRGFRAIDDAISIVAESCMIADALTKLVIADPDRAAPLLVAYGADRIDGAALARAA